MSQAKQNSALGRLTALGVRSPWQAPLYLPDRWDDFSFIARSILGLEVGQQVCIPSRVVRTEVRYDRPPRVVATLSDRGGLHFKASFFGNTKETIEALGACDDLFVSGEVAFYGQVLCLNKPEIVPREWAGRLRPVYAGKVRVISSVSVRDRVLPLLLDQIPVAAEHVEGLLQSIGGADALLSKIGVTDFSLKQLLWLAHRPRSLAEASSCQSHLEFLAAVAELLAAESNRPLVVAEKFEISAERLEHYVSRIPFQLTDEQVAAVDDCLVDLRSGSPMRRLISGDVGSGKTCIYILVAVCAAEVGASIGVLLPNTVLAKQIFGEINQWWPEIDVRLVTGEARSSNSVVWPGQIVVGTSAILSRVSDKLDLVIVDEQQKMARAQRGEMLSPNGHLLEVTATCIPRTAALVRYGVFKASRLTANHTDKTIHTRIWEPEQKRVLLDRVKATVAGGDRVLVVYPLADDSEHQHATVNAAQVWERVFPGRVAVLHGRMTDIEKTIAVQRMRDGDADVLVSTTVVEVGVTIDRLMHVVVVDPSRYGASSLHQLRGRVARHGGVGHCDFLLVGTVKKKTRSRLEILERTCDGFEIAEADMVHRGIGDLSVNSLQQSGVGESFLLSRPVPMDVFDKAFQFLKTV